MSLLRIYKNISVQSGPFNKINRKVTFKESIDTNETIDHSKSYFIARVTIKDFEEFTGIPFTGDVNNKPAHGFYFGNNYPDVGLFVEKLLGKKYSDDVSYNTSCIIQNSRLDSFTKGNLESNRNINFLNQTLYNYINDPKMGQNGTWKGDIYTVNNGVSPYVMTHFTDLKWTGDELSVDKSANIIIPLDRLYMLGKEEMVDMLGDLTYTLELENQDQVVAEYHKYPGNDDWNNNPRIACDGIPDTGTEDRSTITFTGTIPSNITNDTSFVVRWTQGAGTDTEISYLPTNNFLIVGNSILTTGTFDPFFDENVQISNLTVQIYNGDVLVLNPDVIIGEHTVELPSITNKKDIAFYVGERIVLNYNGIVLDPIGLSGYELYRTITQINYNDDTGVAVLTLDGDVLPERIDQDPHNAFIWTPLLKKQATFQIDEFQLVTWKLNYGDNKTFKETKYQPILYNKLVVEPFNRPSSWSFQKTYELPVGTTKHLILNKLTTLLSNDHNLSQWRQYLEQIPTTDRDVLNGQTLNKDKIMNFLGDELKSLYKIPLDTTLDGTYSLGFEGVSLIAELNQSGDPQPILDIQQIATNPTNPYPTYTDFKLESSILYLYCWTAAQITFK